MGMFGRLFGRGKDKEPKGQGQEAGPSPAEQLPAPAPAAPEAPAPAAEKPTKRGLFGRVKAKLRSKDKAKKEEAPAEEAPPAAPSAPPSPPSAGGGTGGGESEGQEGEAEGQEGQEEEEPDPYADAPSSLYVRIPGTWKTSKRKWLGVVEGNLHGDQVVKFLKAMDQGSKKDRDEAVQMVCDDFGDGSFGSGVEVERSSYSNPMY
ncbi:MAG TPA: hypothetical protein VN520_14250 [Streptomyces sp.]|uniref:hypothetical protein n=1 Tax=Streptomyces sp. TaxID=1931 RepID=UPI002BA2191F|nr:hypothetical protein [Streptomyces sp.]HWU07519.1 hypothetical protein [Streptomyces sp.]